MQTTEQKSRGLHGRGLAQGLDILSTSEEADATRKPGKRALEKNVKKSHVVPAFSNDISGSTRGNNEMDLGLPTLEDASTLA